jgi:hypothetical protein
MALTLSNHPTPTLAAPPTVSAASGAPTAFTAGPKTMAERMRYLLAEAQAIVARPEAFRPEEIAWAMDMLSTSEEARQ